MKKQMIGEWYSLDTKVEFGKYNGKTLLEIFKLSPNYVNWFLSEIPNFSIVTDTLNKLIECNPNSNFPR